MSRTKRMMKKKYQKQQKAANEVALREEKNTLLAIEEQREYGEVINKLAEYVSAGSVDADMCYMGAYAYFMLGDYERAAQWADNTMHYDSAHVDARILLARICMLKGQEKDGLKILDFMLANCFLDSSRQAEVKDMLGYYVENEKELLVNKFPNIAVYMNISR